MFRFQQKKLQDMQRNSKVWPTVGKTVNRNCLSLGTSLVVQWLRLHAPNTRGPGSIPGQGTRSHMLQLKILHAAKKILHVATKIPRATTKTRRSQIYK